MTLIGYTMMRDQTDPRQLVRDVTLAGQAAFDIVGGPRPVAPCATGYSRAVEIIRGAAGV